MHSFKLALQMSQAQPPSRFGIFFAGYLFMLAELGTQTKLLIHHRLLMLSQQCPILAAMERS